MTLEEFKKLKVGDTVKFKDNLIVGERYGLLLLRCMGEQMGKKRKINEISSILGTFTVNDEYGFLYHIKMVDKKILIFKFGK